MKRAKLQCGRAQFKVTKIVNFNNRTQLHQKRNFCEEQNNKVTLYRGISKKNFHYERGKRGEVIPNYFLNKIFQNDNEKKTKKLPLEELENKINIQHEFQKFNDNLLLSENHNDNFEGNLNSPFSSWTRSEQVAKLYAGEEGIILKAKLGAPDVKFGFSPDEWNEQEVLVCGVVLSAEIIPLSSPDQLNNNINNK